MWIGLTNFAIYCFGSLTFIIAVLQPNVRTKGQENQPAWGRLAG